MKKAGILLLSLISWTAFAQTATTITLTAPAKSASSATLILEDAHFHPNLGIGLADVKLDPVAQASFNETTTEKTTIRINEPKIARLQYSGGGVNKTWVLFLQPGDDLTATFPGDGNVTFSGKNAPYQDFLKKHFMENQYQYLPVFGYKPAQIDNKSVIQQSDSLRQARLTAFDQFKKAQAPVPAFEAYVLATTATEPALIHRMIQEKIMRRNRVKSLDPAQRKELEELTLRDFKILPDDALLSGAYRDELRNWVLIPSIRKFPVKEENRYEISPEALKDVYANSKEKLKGYPRQQEYLLTYWLNYAATAIPSTETADALLADFKSSYPQSTNGTYIANLLTTRKALTPGAALPDVTLLGKDSAAVLPSARRGKPVVMIFAFSIGQHEPNMKALETKYAGKATFAYISVAPGISFSTWKQYAKDRSGALHFWASDDSIEQLKEKYAVDIRYPFLVADAAGKIVDRWIPQEFPDNQTLDAAIGKAITK